jgi:hypothetical protein
MRSRLLENTKSYILCSRKSRSVGILVRYGPNVPRSNCFQHGPKTRNTKCHRNLFNIFGDEICKQMGKHAITYARSLCAKERLKMPIPPLCP